MCLRTSPQASGNKSRAQTKDSPPAQTLAEQWTAAYGKGFTEKGLWRMVQFADVFPDLEIVATLSRQLSWIQFVDLFPLGGSLKCDFYAELSPCRMLKRSHATCKGFDERNLRYMRMFFLTFPIRNALRSKSTAENKSKKQILDAVRLKSASGELAPNPHAPRAESGPSLRPELSWTHYRLLLAVENAEAREWYMHEAADEHWSTRQLERQISTQYCERLLASRKKGLVRKEAAGKLAKLEPEQFIRDPNVLEF